MGRRLPIVVFCLSAAAPAVLGAQEPAAAPFGTVGISLSATAHADLSDNLGTWDAGPGVELRALLPFYAGSIELGASQSTFDSRAPAVPGFRARYIFVGWGAGVRPASRLLLRAVTRLGVYDLQFDSEDLPSYARSENEVATELGAEADVALGGGWSVIGGGAGRLVLTEPRMRQFVVSAGARRTFTSPRWLRDFLD
jgi:hypothetical protein